MTTTKRKKERSRALTRLRIQIDCPDCKDHPDDQPNHCRKCGGSQTFYSIVSLQQLMLMADIPEVRGASLVFVPSSSAVRR
jgi:hypothetical protein